MTNEYNLGAQKTLEIARENGIEIAILKSKSPSCSNMQVYDGTYTHTLVNGKGVTACLLEKNNVKVISENELEKL